MPAIVVFALPGCLVIAHASIEETQLKFARRTKPVVLSLRFSPCAGTWSQGDALGETTRPIAWRRSIQGLRASVAFNVPD